MLVKLDLDVNNDVLTPDLVQMRAFGSSLSMFTCTLISWLCVRCKHPILVSETGNTTWSSL